MRIFLISMSCFLTAFCLYGQELADKNVRIYIKTVHNHASIYSGKEEPRYKVKIQNHPYLDTETFRKGTLRLNGTIYPDVLMRLNQDLEELAVMSPNSHYSILIPREQLDYAQIDSLFIVYRQPVSANGRVLPKGYYIRIYDGETQVWKRKISFLNSRIHDLSLEYFFENTTRMYVYKDGIYHPVNSKKSLLKLFASQKKELKKRMKQSGLSYRENPEHTVVGVTRYYDELNK